MLRAQRPANAPDLADLRKRLRPETRMIVLSHLHNPTGLPLLDSDLAALAELCEAAGIWLVLDEIYGAFADDRGLAALRSPAVISLSGLSKIFGLGRCAAVGSWLPLPWRKGCAMPACITIPGFRRCPTRSALRCCGTGAGFGRARRTSLMPTVRSWRTG
jgi:hypothetical protein